MSGVDAIHVPFRGTSDAIAALGLGDIDYFLDAPSAFEPLVRQGKAKVVAATTAKRTIDRPDVPGMEEEGLALDLLITYGIVTPKGVPREVVTTLVEEMKAFSARPDMREKYLAMGQGVPVWSTPEEYAAQVKREIVTYQEAAKFIGFNPE